MVLKIQSNLEDVCIYHVNHVNHVNKQKQATNTYTVLVKLREQLLKEPVGPLPISKVLAPPCTFPAPGQSAMYNILIW